MVILQKNPVLQQTRDQLSTYTGMMHQIYRLSTRRGGDIFHTTMLREKEEACFIEKFKVLSNKARQI